MSAARRDFLKSSVTALAGLYAGTRFGVAKAARGDKVRLAVVGIGGRGYQLIEAFAATGLAEFAAFAEVDVKMPTAAETLRNYPDVPLYADFRLMLDDREAEIDAVVVATPDHAHVPPAIDAMRRGKHLYCEKPLAHTWSETQLLIDAAARSGVVTQMGNQGHSAENYRQAVEFDRAGLFDDVTKVIAHANVGRTWKGLKKSDIRDYFDKPVPDHLAWDLWLGPRPETPYSRELHPAKWRRWHRFGCGLMGDWGSHTLDTAHRFLNLGLPTRVEALHRLEPHPLLYPDQTTVRFDFPATETRGPVEVIWRGGLGNDPEVRPLLAGSGEPLKAGKHFFKADGTVLRGASHCAPLYGYGPDGEPIETPDYEGKEDASHWDKWKYTFHTDDHALNFVRACLGLEETNSPFSVGGPLVRMIHVGRAAQRLGGALDFDPAAESFVGDRADEANALLEPEPVRGEWAEFYKI